MKIALLGSTGSIGRNTLKIARLYGIEVEMLVAGNNTELLQRQIQEFRPKIVVSAKKVSLDAPKVLYGEAGILEALELCEAPLVVNALVGFLGLRPTIKALELGKRVALANKESLVVAGEFLDRAKITPIDSEHFGLWYLLQNRLSSKKLVITASGGAFRDWEVEWLEQATLQDALKHPNWAMGPKITIDSATMVNKLFELLEAYWLFGNRNLDAVIEPTSTIHAIVEHSDGSTTFHASVPDMKLPIAYALGVKNRPILAPINLLDLRLEFRSIDKRRYPVWTLKEDLLARPFMGVVVNAANEAAIKRFIDGEFGFLDIAYSILEAYEKFGEKPTRLEDIFALDKEVREYVATL